MQLTIWDKFKKIVATILGIDIQLVNLIKVQYKKNKRARVQKAFKEWWKRKWEKY